MPFYRDASRLENKSQIVQGKEGNCYVIAPIAAADLAGIEADVGKIKVAVGTGMGGTSDRAFKAMGLYGLTKAEAYKDAWPTMIKGAVESRWPACLGIAWENMDGPDDKPRPRGNHVIYVTGHEAGIVYARDQQNGQVLISVRMGGDWLSEEFVAGTRTSRTCNVKWVGIGFPNRDAASRFIAAI